MNIFSNIEKFFNSFDNYGLFSFDDFCLDVCTYLSPDFLKKNESWLIEYNGEFNDWCIKLHDNKCPEEAAKIIERAFNLYLKK